MRTGPLVLTAPVPSAPIVFTPEQMTAAIMDLGQVVAGIRSFLAGSYAPQPQLPPVPPPPPLPSPAATTTYQYGMPFDGTVSHSTSTAPPPSQGVPIQQIRFPPSPSPLPAWITGTTAPIYTAPSPQPYLQLPPTTGAHVAHGSIPASGVLYGGVDGTLIPGSSLFPPFPATTSPPDHEGAAFPSLCQEPPPLGSTSWSSPRTTARLIP